MRTHPRIALAIVLVLLAGSGVATGRSVAAIAPGCANPVDSALNQYCDTIPTSAGAQVPNIGTPSLGSALPRTVVAKIERAGRRSGQPLASRRRVLLSLPAPGHRTSLNTRAAIAEGPLLPLWLLLVLVGLAVAMAALTVVTRNRDRDEG